MSPRTRVLAWVSSTSVVQFNRPQDKPHRQPDQGGGDGVQDAGKEALRGFISKRASSRWVPWFLIQSRSLKLSLPRRFFQVSQLPNGCTSEHELGTHLSAILPLTRGGPRSLGSCLQRSPRHRGLPKQIGHGGCERQTTRGLSEDGHRVEDQPDDEQSERLRYVGKRFQALSLLGDSR